MTHTTALAPVLAEHIAAVNAFDENAIVATFAGDALVNDAHREFWGREAIRRWVARELAGDRWSCVPYRPQRPGRRSVYSPSLRLG
jgi:ketosteroid isomerase-like protein